MHSFLKIGILHGTIRSPSYICPPSYDFLNEALIPLIRTIPDMLGFKVDLAKTNLKLFQACPGQVFKRSQYRWGSVERQVVAKKMLKQASGFNN